MGWADNCRDGGTYIGKDGKKHSYDRLIVNPPANQGGGCGFCLLNLSLMLAAPTAVVALASVGRKGWSSARARARLCP